MMLWRYGFSPTAFVFLISKKQCILEANESTASYKYMVWIMLDFL